MEPDQIGLFFLEHVFQALIHFCFSRTPSISKMLVKSSPSTRRLARQDEAFSFCLVSRHSLNGETFCLQKIRPSVGRTGRTSQKAMVLDHCYVVGWIFQNVPQD